MSPFRKSAPLVLVPLLFGLGLALAAGAPALAADPAAGQVDSLDNALLETMKASATQSFAERYRKLEPVVQRVFDLPAMTRVAVGPAWTGFTPAQQEAVIAAFTKLTVASYVHNFRGFDGERFILDPNVATRGADKIVQTQIAPRSGAPQALLYRMRSADGVWKIIDVYYGAISQLTTRRADFAGPVASGGAAGLIAHLNELSAGLMK